MEEPKKMDLRSMDMTEEHKAKLKQIFPHVFNEDKIDFERLKQTLGEDVDTGLERFGLTWPGKAECMKIIQQPSIGTLKPCKEESVNFDTTENLFIEGDNLEVLKLLQKSYYGKVKMIYIDPPYNTGKEFIYPDKYSETMDTYLAYTGQVDAEGKKFSTNTEADGRFHSKWINMLHPRLFLARNLLCDDGAICVSIGDEELHNLRTLMNEIFGEENHRNTIIVRRFDKNLSRQFMDSGLNSLAVGYEYVLIYSKNQSFTMNPVFREASEERQENGYWKGFWNASDRPTMRFECLGVKPETGQWKWKETTAREAVENYSEYIDKYSQAMTLEEYWDKTGKIKKFIRRNSNGKGRNFGVEHWVPPSIGILRTSNWTDLLASESLSSLNIPFDNPKSRVLIKNLICLCCDEDDLVLDFFAGSGTTAHSIIELNEEDEGNRRFILVQLPESLDKDAEPFKAGFKAITDIGQERIRRVINNIKGQKSRPNLGFKVFKLDQSNFKIWDGIVDQTSDGKKIEKQLELQIEHINPKATEEKILYELLLKSGFALTTRVEVLQMAGKRVYSIENGALLICLEKNLTKEVITEMARKEPARVICLDSGFSGNDQLKTNAVQIMKSHKVEDFRTV